MNKHEVKFANTAKRIQQAILALLETNEFIDISIADICSKANINRSTFYAHYNNTIELIKELEADLLAEFERNNTDLIKREILNKANLSPNHVLIDNAILSVYLDYVKKYRRVFIIYNHNPIFSRNNHEQILKEMVFIPAFKANGIFNEIVMDYMFTYFLAGINSIINKWVAEDCKESTERICEIIRLCILRQ